MPHLQRRTTLLLAIFVAVSQLVGAYGFYSYQMSAITYGSFPSSGMLAPESGYVGNASTWGSVYLCAVLAGILLSVFAAKGSKLICAMVLVLVIPAIPWAAMLLITSS
jgi:hypothetical protein